ncbi:DNA-cytosine methyltransferase [Knoellia sinensis KCTC 19936]|uniref:Cytosine-specific methyltransferase n=1 Tax=Knoellia sinensis KCTC 19936 TaxID=1385520 RepID=A0A0A0IZG5_9MICO|nr:DNA (cytosine-5-)-methyltransferase [Knoellia sinensis]KGN30540.1 DNA-cytosine methyltransferase [Knoellia sinensis KCTC 19936]
MEQHTHGKDGPDVSDRHSFTFIDLFAGIGGTRLGFEAAGGQCVFTSEWNSFAQRTYAANFPDSQPGPASVVDANIVGHSLVGDITEIRNPQKEIPPHDVLLAGFPCQPFSIAGVSKKNSLGRPHGFQDPTQGTLFFEIKRILEAHRPRAFLLENVRNLVSHDRGRTFDVIRHALEDELGYNVQWRILDASAWVPQGRRRIYIVGFDGATDFDFETLTPPDAHPTMSSVLHPEDGSERSEEPFTLGPSALVNPKYTLSPKLWNYLQGYARKHREAGNGFGFGLVSGQDVSRTLSARYYKDGSEILVSQGDGHLPRRLTPRECARLMGFPEDYKIPVSDTQAYKQFGNSVVVPVVESIARHMAPHVTTTIQRAAAS